MDTKGKQISTQNSPPSFPEALDQLITLADSKPSITVREITEELSGRGYAALLILFSLPFCLPIQIPGFSTPFGIFLCLIGLRIAFGKHPWWPQWLLEKQVESAHVSTLATKALNLMRKLQRFVHPRWTFLSKHPLFHRLNGLLIFSLALLLALPLPIPFTNLLTAFPLFFLGIGLLEDDGLFIILSYALTCLAFGVFLGIVLVTAHFFLN